jgi:SAM-dependent methyltransferase
MNSYYGNLCSWFYDIDKPRPDNEELEFYLSFVNKNADILEPMCGSGRFLIEFIKKEYRIDGFDLSKDMLERCKQKLHTIKGECNLRCCDFLNYPLNKMYDFIFIPSGSFSLIINDNDIINNLNILERLCKINGKIIIELEIGNSVDKINKYSEKKMVKENNFEIIFSYNVAAIKENIVYSVCKYELYDKGKHIKTEEENFNIKYYKPNEFERYLKTTRLIIENKYVNYKKEKYNGEEIDKIIYELIK